VYNQCVTALANQHLNGMTFFFRLMVAVANQDILLMLLGNHITAFTSAPKNASDTSMTTTPIVSLTCVASACALALGR
jgi:hypothetical protein